MIIQQVEVKNRLGLHARAAAKLVRLASGFACEIHLSRLGDIQRIDGKSILGILMLAASRGTILEFTLEGLDEKQASHAISELFEGRFGEDE
jgi:phosphocarrier protein HPr